MNISDEARQEMLDITLRAIEHILEGDGRKNFALATLSYRQQSFFGFGRESETLLEVILKQILRENFEAAIKKAINVEAIEAAVKEEIEKINIPFLAKGVTNDFLERLSQPIKMDGFKVELFSAVDEDYQP